MHRCLLIAEVQSFIFSSGILKPDEIQFGYFGGGNRRIRNLTLLSLALTCRAFTEEALDALWSVLYDILPLIECMQVAGQEKHDRCITTDLAPMLKYTKRIKVLVIPPSFHPRSYSHDTMTRLAMHLSSISLPHLSTLHCPGHLDWAEILPLIQGLFNSNITTLSFHISILCDKNFNHTYSTLQSLGERCSRIENFHLVGDHMSPYKVFRHVQWDFNRSGVILDSLDVWENLRSFHCGFIDRMRIAHLAQSSSLRNLGIYILDRTLRGSTPPKFQHLTKLHVTAPKLSTVTRFMECIQSPLQELDVKCLYEPSSNELETLCTAISQNIPSDTLKSLVMCFDHLYDSLEFIQDEVDPGVDYNAPAIIDIKVLRPLLPFRQLESFVLGGGFRDFVWDDDTIGVLAQAWPDIQRLEFGQELEWVRYSQITSAGVTRLRALCPKLKYLTMEVKP